jgi:hypothetical protein
MEIENRPFGSASAFSNQPGAEADPWGLRRAPQRWRVELLGSATRAIISLDQAAFSRVSDWANFVLGYFNAYDVSLVSSAPGTSRIHLPETRLRLDEFSVIAQNGMPERQIDPLVVVKKQARPVLVVTDSHFIFGDAHIHPQAQSNAFLEANEPRFLPLTNTRIRAIDTHRLVGRYDLALVQRTHIVAFATSQRRTR